MKKFVRKVDITNLLESEVAVIQELIDYNSMLYAKKKGREKATVGRELISLQIRKQQTQEILRYVEEII